MMIAMWMLACTPEPQDNAAVDALEERVTELEKQVKELQTRGGLPHDIDGAELPGREEPRPARPDLGTEFSCVADGADFVLESGYDDIQRDPVAAMGRVQVLPSRGGADGVKILGIRKGTGPESCGFQNGDTVHSVNGEVFRGEDDVMVALPMLVDDPPWDIEVTRRGELLTWQVRLP